MRIEPPFLPPPPPPPPPPHATRTVAASTATQSTANPVPIFLTKLPPIGMQYFPSGSGESTPSALRRHVLHRGYFRQKLDQSFPYTGLKLEQLAKSSRSDRKVLRVADP